MAINLTNKLNAATTDKVLVDAIQVAGGYMAITSDQRANLTSAQKVAGTLVYETDTGKTYRYIKTAPDKYEWKEEIVQKQGDWNQPDETAPDYIKNRTHYEIAYAKQIFPLPEYGSDVALWATGDIVGNHQKVCILNDMYGHEMYGDELVTADNCGKTYRFSSTDLLGDIAFEGVLKQGFKTAGGAIFYYLGNPAYSEYYKTDLPQEDTGEKFCILATKGSSSDDYGNMHIFVEVDTTKVDQAFFDGFKSPEIKIEHIYQEVKTLDEKYIPNTIAKAEHNHEFKDIIDSAYDDSSKWKEITDLLNQHVYGDLITVYTGNDCRSLGMGYRICECCGHKKLEQIKVDHTWDLPTINIDDATHNKVCAVCGTTKTEPHDIDYYAYEDGGGTYIVYSVCNTCGMEVGSSHSHFACGDIGCTKCDLIIPNPDPNGCTHKWESIGSGGSDETGWNNFYECSKCGEYIEVTVD